LWIALGLLGLLLFGVIGLAGLLLLGDDDGDTETAGRNDRTDDPVTTEPGTGNTTETNSTSPEGTVPTPGTGVDQTIPDDEPIMREPTMSLELDDAIVDIEEYFAEVYPQLYGEPWVPVAEVFALSDLDGPTLDCGIAVPVERNAFYCSLGDFIAYDDVSLFPFLEERFGDLAPAMALAHEWAHAVQGRQGLLRTVDTVFTELQADCLAGAWSGRLLSGEGNMVGVSQADVDLAIGGWVFLGDRIGIPIDDPGAHGTGFDRVGAFGDGVTNGAQACVDYVSGGVTPVDIGVDDEFFQTQGNLDFETALDTLEVSLDQYWDGVAADLGVAEPDPTVLGAVSSSPGCTIEAGFGAAACDDQGLVVYRDNWVNVHNDIGDFATALVIAEAYAEVVSDDLGFEPTEARLECLAGSWAGSDSIQLSAGDLDEAILTFIGLGASERSVFDSVSSFQRGYFAGFEGCI
jgi:predicted metalloprotease